MTEKRSLKMLTSNGQDRPIKVSKVEGITIRTVLDDSGHDIDIDKQYFTVIKPLKGEPESEWVAGQRMTLETAEDFLWELVSGIDDVTIKYVDATLENFDPKGNEAVFLKVKDYCDQPVIGDTHKSMILHSKAWGVGKTHLLCSLARRWYNNPRTHIELKNGEIRISYAGVYYKIIREEDLMLRIRATYAKDAKENESDVYKDLDRYDILAIDDVGKYTPASMDFYHRVMFQIIDDRYNKGKGVVISSNLDMVGMANFLGGAIADRLNEMAKGYQLELKGESHRGKSQC